jgi:hypothetical protein
MGNTAAPLLSQYPDLRLLVMIDDASQAAVHWWSCGVRRERCLEDPSVDELVRILSSSEIPEYAPVKSN